MSIQILVIGGSRRTGNYSQHAAQLVVDTINSDAVADASAELLLVADTPFPQDNEGYAVKLGSLPTRVAAADALIIVSPEYNHSYPGSLKYILDTIPKMAHRKPAGVVGVSSGPFGGTRVIEALSLVLRELGFLVISEDVHFSQVKQEFVDGQWVDQAKWQERIGRQVEELVWIGKRLNQRG